MNKEPGLPEQNDARNRIQERNIASAKGVKMIIVDDYFPTVVSNDNLDQAFEIFKVRCMLLNKPFDQLASMEGFMWGCRLMARLLILDELDVSERQEREKVLLDGIEKYFPGRLKPFPTRKGADDGMLDFSFFYG